VPIQSPAQTTRGFSGYSGGVFLMAAKPTIDDDLKANLCNLHDLFVKRTDLPALVGILTRPD
jgi:hypothetical protein